MAASCRMQNLLIAFNLEGVGTEESTLGGGVMRRNLFTPSSPAALPPCSSPTSALAHHGAASIYDMSKETTIKATVTGSVWTNPHVELGSRRRGGTTTELLLELGSPPNIRNRGWTSRTVKTGDVITVTFHPGLRGAKIGVVVKLVDGGRQGAPRVIRHLVALSTAAALFAAAACSKPAAAPAAPAHPNLSARGCALSATGKSGIAAGERDSTHALGRRKVQGRAAGGGRQPGLRQHHRSVAEITPIRTATRASRCTRCDSSSFRPTTTYISSGNTTRTGGRSR